MNPWWKKFLNKNVEVPALGVYRGGKSLLLNRLMQRRAPYSNSFGVGHGQQTFTRCRCQVLLVWVPSLKKKSYEVVNSILKMDVNGRVQVVVLFSS